MNNGKADLKKLHILLTLTRVLAVVGLILRITVEFFPSESMKTFVSIIKLGFVPTVAPLVLISCYLDNKIRQKKGLGPYYPQGVPKWQQILIVVFVCFMMALLAFVILAVVFCDK